ncbi:MAG: hypothetical protein ACFB4J_14590 [Elainellaceae cyanobacterium]
MAEGQLDPPAAPIEWRSWYYSSIEALRHNGIKIIVPIAAPLMRGKFDLRQ